MNSLPLPQDMMLEVSKFLNMKDFRNLSSTCKEMKTALEPLQHKYEEKMNEIFQGSISELVKKTNDAKSHLDSLISSKTLEEDFHKLSTDIDILSAKNVDNQAKISQYVFIPYIDKSPLMLKIAAFFDRLFPSLKIQEQITEFQNLRNDLEENIRTINTNKKIKETIKATYVQDCLTFEQANVIYTNLSATTKNQISFFKMLTNFFPTKVVLSKIEIKKVQTLKNLYLKINEKSSPEPMKPNSVRIYIDEDGYRGLFFCTPDNYIVSLQETPISHTGIGFNSYNQRCSADARCRKEEPSVELRSVPTGIFGQTEYQADKVHSVFNLMKNITL